MTLAERWLATMRAAAACGCGGAAHPEHELDDLALDMIDRESGIGADFFLVTE